MKGQTKLAYALLISTAMISVSLTAKAGTLCGNGYITKYENIYGNDSSVRFSISSMPAGYGQYEYIYGLGYMINMWQKDSALRWSDKLRIIEMAYALRSSVQIISNDSNCLGNQDEFDITLCNTESDCANSRN